VSCSALLNRRLVGLGRHLDRLHWVTDVVRVWYWTRGVLFVYQAGQQGPGPRLTEAEIGARLGEGASRPPYSKAWVSYVLSAARRWPERPQTPAEWADFLAALNGRKPRGKRADGAARGPSLGRARQGRRRAVLRAGDAGYPPAEIRRIVEGVLAARPSSVGPPWPTVSAAAHAQRDRPRDLGADDNTTLTTSAPPRANP
jgi:hypothetical protein